MDHKTTIDLDDVFAAPGAATQRVGVAFDDDGNPTAGFVIVSKDSQQFRDTAARLRVSGIKRQAVKAQRIDTKTEEGAAAWDSLIQNNEEALAAAVVIDWFGFTAGGQPAPFSAEGVRKMFKAKPTWREKVSAAMENEAAFLSPSPTNSVSSPGTSSD